MRVAAVEARPLRSLADVRVELGAGDRQRDRAQRRRQDQPARGALLRPHRPLLPHRRPPRADPLRRPARRAPRRWSATRTGSSTGCSPRSAAPRVVATCSTATRPTRRPSPATARPVAVFSPDRLTLVKGPPAERRAHLDRFLAARWPSRSELRQRYGQALAQRNALLAARRRFGGDLEVWDAALAAAAEPLIAARAEAVAELAAPFAAAARSWAWRERATIEYAPRPRARRRRSERASPSGGRRTRGSAGPPGARTSTS